MCVFLRSLKSLIYNLTLSCNKIRYNEPQKLEMKDVNKSDTPAKEGKVNYLMNYLASMKSGTKVFQHFLAKSNLSQILEGKQGFKNSIIKRLNIL